MARNKSNFLSFVLIIFCVTVAYVNAKSFEVGHRDFKRDKHVCNFNIVEPNYEESPNPNKCEPLLKNKGCITKSFSWQISYVKAEDLGSGGEVTIASGGLKKRHIVLRFKNKPGQTLNYTINVFAIKDKKI